MTKQKEMRPNSMHEERSSKKVEIEEKNEFMEKKK